MKNATDNPRAALARRADLVVQDLPDETLVYDLRQHKAHCLNKTAAFVWQHCDGDTTVTEMAGLLQREMGTPIDSEMIWYALERLAQADLLEAKATPPVNVGLSRRRLIKRLGAGAMLAIPAVTSLIAPTAVQAATVIVTPKKIADGTCKHPPGPSPGANCLFDTCCTGSKRVCEGNSLASDCTGQNCEPAGNASDC